MILRNYNELSKDKHPVLQGIELCQIRDLKGRTIENLDLRIFEILPGAENPLHTHAYSHDLFVTKGQGQVHLDGSVQQISEGDVVAIAPNEPHSFANDSNEVLQFICMDCQIVEGP